MPTQVRWWDNPVDPAVLKTYVPFRDHSPKVRYIFSNMELVPELDNQYLVYNYTFINLLPHSSERNQPGTRWTTVRVTAPRLAPGSWVRSSLCCDSGYEDATRPTVAELVLRVC